MFLSMCYTGQIIAVLYKCFKITVIIEIFFLLGCNAEWICS